MAEFATLGDVRAHLNLSSTSNDGELTLMLDAAEDIVRDLIGGAPDQVTERITASGGLGILSRRPAYDVEVEDGTVTGFTVNPHAGLVYDLPAWHGPMSVTYTVGDGSVPSAVTLATVIIAGHLWETQRGTSPTALTLQGEDAGPSPLMGFAIPNRAKDLLEPFMPSRSSIA